MKFWDFVLNCVIVGLIAFAVAVLVSFLFNVIVYGSAAVAWGTSLRIAVILALVIPLSNLVKIKSDKPEK